jgi:hypothetical protein
MQHLYAVAVVPSKEEVAGVSRARLQSLPAKRSHVDRGGSRSERI